MDDRRFDSLVKSLASGGSRRSMLKGMLGLGGAAVATSVLSDSPALAARRPDPTPKPVKCPGTQTWDGTECVCDVPPAPGPHKCGSDCCTGETDDPYPREAGHSECCDNACCFGTCYGEELCCPTNLTAGGGPATHQLCEGSNGTSCCGIDQPCCGGVCCDTICVGGEPETESCCDEASFCPGGSQSPDLCCAGGTECCGGGTDENTCIDLSVDGACCTVDDCSPPGEGDCGCACVGGLCLSVVCTQGDICCQGECVSDLENVTCPDDPNECCDRETQICCGGTACCAEDQCAAGTCCTGDDLACGEECCPSEQCAAGVQCCLDGTSPCGEVCCDDLTQKCGDQGICECLDGFIPSGEGCVFPECWGDDNSTCAALGYDLGCTVCIEGRCEWMLDGSSCNSPSAGYCSQGECLCRPTGTECSVFYPAECCSRICAGGLCIEF